MLKLYYHKHIPIVGEEYTNSPHNYINIPTIMPESQFAQRKKDIELFNKVWYKIIITYSKVFFCKQKILQFLFWEFLQILCYTFYSIWKLNHSYLSTSSSFFIIRCALYS